MKTRTAGEPAHALHRHDHDDTPDAFIRPALDTFTLVGRAVLVLTAGCAVLDLAGVVAAWTGEIARLPSPPAIAAGAAGVVLVCVAAGLLASIQVRYTFEHGHTRKRHFYELRLARWNEAAAALRSLAAADAVPAVRALGDLRRETGMLDRRLVVETLVLKRRWRDLTWFPLAGATAALAGAGALIAVRAAGLEAALVPAAFPAVGVLALLALELWARERVGKVVELLAPAPADLARAFDPTPRYEAVIESLLCRINQHFDRLNGLRDGRVEL